MILLYHGSEYIIEHPEYGKGKLYNDYGRGFYCTQDIELAKEWSASKETDGYANIYNLDITNLSVLDLTRSEYSILHWLTILLQNRVFDLKNDIAKAGKEYLIKNYSIDISNIDIIIGYRADDSYFSFAQAFLNNTISIQRLEEAFKLGDLGTQIVLVSPKAFNNLFYVQSERVDHEKYYQLRNHRNNTARASFLSNKVGISVKDSIYLSDIIRGK